MPLLSCCYESICDGAGWRDVENVSGARTGSTFIKVVSRTKGIVVARREQMIQGQFQGVDAMKMELDHLYQFIGLRHQE